ncbi:hypothetical protein IOCL1545_000469300 [Leishmania shawi]|uniref:Secreted protein n=1 Tax=Leishmania shawi TaxID=5680 RepID=A0ABR3E558_9TRYP
MCLPLLCRCCLLPTPDSMHCASLTPKRHHRHLSPFLPSCRPVRPPPQSAWDDVPLRVSSPRLFDSPFALPRGNLVAAAVICVRGYHCFVSLPKLGESRRCRRWCHFIRASQGVRGPALPCQCAPRHTTLVDTVAWLRPYPTPIVDHTRSHTRRRINTGAPTHTHINRDSETGHN